ncbi:MAG TPA: thioether cross-link-forming SCIFF peptide maturase [Clostridiales bacterium]|nr:thioether cross-link-forming SCIFF peptide maturase [Clostridiales bacterium]
MKEGFIHKFSLNGTNTVVDVNSGSVHIFDPVAYEVLDYYAEDFKEEEIIAKLGDKYGKEQVHEAFKEITQLKQEGMLFSEDEYHFSVAKNNDIQFKAMCLHVSHDCNMRCRYCFASKGDFGSGRKLMDVETGKKAIDFLIKNSGKRRNLEVDFFGGEPLMNFDVMKDIVSYAREKEQEYNKNFRFTVTTNALLLDKDKMDYINENFVNVVLSLDGRKEINDKMRVRVDNSGTYSHIIQKIKDMAESRNQENYYVRGTYTRENIDFSNDVLHLADEGFKQVSVEPVVAAAGSGYDIREEDLPEIKAEYEKLALEYVNRNNSGSGFNFFHFMIDLEHGPCAEKRYKGCGSGFEYIAVTPEGDIYPCHQFVGIDEFKMGNVYDGNIDDKIVCTFKNCNITSKDECSRCWAKFYCGGGCAANAFNFNKDINKPYKVGCELEKKRVECALWIKTQIHSL